MLFVYKMRQLFMKRCTRVCLKNHSCNLHAPLCGIFCLHSVDVARYAALIQTKSPTNCDIYLAESIFKTHSSIIRKKEQEEMYISYLFHVNI